MSIASSVSPCHSTTLDSKTPADCDSAVCRISWDTGCVSSVSSKGVSCRCKSTVLVFASMNTSEETRHSVTWQIWMLQMRQTSLALFSHDLCIRSFQVLPVDTQNVINGIRQQGKSYQEFWNNPPLPNGPWRNVMNTEINAIPNAVLCVFYRDNRNV